MRRQTPRRRWWILPILGLVVGSTAGAATVAIASTGEEPAAARPVFDATHLPPLLTTPGERVDLSYDAHCATGTEEGDTACDVRGSVFLRQLGTRTFAERPLEPRSVDGQLQLATTVPASLAAQAGGFEYFAVLDAPALGQQIVLPAGGAAAPQSSRVLERSVEVALGRHAFGRDRRAGTRMAFARWGDGPADVGLEPGRGLGPVGASSFDVDASGRIVILDQVHRRLLRWSTAAGQPARVPVSVAGTIADLAVGGDGSVFVLETAARDGREAQVKRFDDGGRELDAIQTAERTPSQIRMSPAGPLVLAQPSNQWLPVAVDGAPAPPSEQRTRGRAGRRFAGGVEVVLLRRADELRLALVAGERITRSWRVTSDTPLAEVQLAEPLAGQRLVVVLRVYDDRADEFVVVVLGRQGILDRFALDSADWAETAPFGRFRLAGKFLYRFGSTSAGAFVDRFDLEVS
jgi:hypothetical protein